MWKGVVAVIFAVLVVAGGLLAFLKSAREPLPKGLPKPLTDKDDEEWKA
jgi:hypothetical protein